MEYFHGSVLYKGIVFGKPDREGDLMLAKSDGGWSFTHVVRGGFKAKTGHTEILKGIMSHQEACPIAKAYFSAPTFTGSYEERQKQAVKHYKWKVGSKVRVVRKFEAGEDGYHGQDWDSDNDKAYMQDKEMFLVSICDGFLGIDPSPGGSYYPFPYFALEPVT